MLSSDSMSRQGQSGELSSHRALFNASHASYRIYLRFLSHMKHYATSDHTSRITEHLILNLCAEYVLGFHIHRLRVSVYGHVHSSVNCFGQLIVTGVN
jgi:hypothetical protein